MLRSTAKFATILFTGALVFAGGNIKANAESVYNSTAVAGVTISVDSYLTNVGNQTTVQATTTENTAVADPTAAPTDPTEVAPVDATAPVDPAAVTEATTEAPSANADLVLAKVEESVNMRKKNNTDSDVVGKMYKGDAGKIIKQKDGWTKVESGNAKGWVKDDFLVFGDEAANYGTSICDRIATVTTTTLKVRDKKSVESDCLTMIPEGQSYDVVKEYKNWVRISIDGDVQGYVSKDFVKVETDYGQALTSDEIQAAEDAAAAQLAAQLAAQQPTTTEAQVSASKPVEKKKSTKVVKTPSGSTLNETSTSSSSSGGSAANYALQFVGNPYVFGGSSLTNGADCSGFTMSVYAHFGYSLPHSAAAQSGCGTSVSLSNLQAGDLLFYSNGGGINHVAMYVGGGMVVHASTAKTGIKTSVYNYRTPVKAVRIMK